MRVRVLALLATVSVLVVGLVAFDVGGVGRTLGVLSRPSADPVIDGWAVGAARPDEAGYIDVATRLLDTQSPAHANIVRASAHLEGVYVDRDGRQILFRRSGSCCVVVLFDLTDGSQRAVGAGTVGVDPTVMAIETGPARYGLATPH